MPLLSIARPELLYRLILDHALDSFIAIDKDSRIMEWNRQAELSFGWSRAEILGQVLTDTLIPERFRASHLAGIKRYLESGQHNILGRRIELSARRKDGSEIPVELTVTPINEAGEAIFSASLRDLSRYRALEKQVHWQAQLTRSVLDSMVDAITVTDLSERLILVNPAGQRLLGVQPAQSNPEQTYRHYQLLRTDGKTPWSEAERPMARALRGERVDGMLAVVWHPEREERLWLSINAGPLVDDEGARIGGVAVFHDITELRQREQDLLRQAHKLREQANLLDMTRDAIMVCNADGTLSYWNRGAEKLYEYSREEVLGRDAHALLQTLFPVPREQILITLKQEHHWEGELKQRSKSGRQIIVHSQWVLDVDRQGPGSYLETNTDISDWVRTGRALRQTQENYRLLVETASDVAMIVMDPAGWIVSWNLGAENILGLPREEAVGKAISQIFTPEDRRDGKPEQELAEARERGRAEDSRWHQKKDGSRFWANGVVMPLWNDDGSLRGFVKILRDQTDLRLEVEQTQFLANHDMLTGLPNRIHFSNRLHQLITHADRNRVPLAILLLDLDRFKQVNDTLGHHAGDLLLKEVAQRIRSTLRESDFVARLGGDEFVVIQYDTAQPEAAQALARKLISTLSRPYTLERHVVTSGASVGISTYPGDAGNPVDLLKKADLALYRAKHHGRGSWQCYVPDLQAEKTRERNREQGLRAAWKNHEFQLYYQPQVDLDNWKISAVEALLRWQAPDLEMLLPNAFLGLAESTGMIVEIGEWVLRQACRQAKAWHRLGMPDLRISLNCSARQFGDPRFVQLIGPVLEDSGLDPSCLELEIGEAMLAQSAIREQLSGLRELGVKITIDNYGTGSTALIDFQEFEIDGLKIDRTFVQHLPHRQKDSAITSSIIHLAHSLGIIVTAGGVETAEQLAYLKSMACNRAQGFLFSPPVPAGKFEELMLEGHWSRINQLPLLHDS
jgi:diguanylate cyclase (GGDEF)-like protein/PAS domain S-box-containing protein